jgi:hypothetical protein
MRDRRSHQSELHVGYAACSVTPHPVYMPFLSQSASAVVESKAEAKVVTRRTFQLARFWLNADAE